MESRIRERENAGGVVPSAPEWSSKFFLKEVRQ